MPSPATLRCPWCAGLYASKRGLAKHALKDGCPQRYLDWERMAERKLKPKPTKKPAADELKELFARMERGE